MIIEILKMFWVGERREGKIEEGRGEERKLLSGDGVMLADQ